MAVRSFQQYLREQSVSKTLEVVNNGVEIIINISLSRHERHAEVIHFLRRVADELSALEKASRKDEKT
jgi:hypothetical protein